MGKIKYLKCLPSFNGRGHYGYRYTKIYDAVLPSRD